MSKLTEGQLESASKMAYDAETGSYVKTLAWREIDEHERRRYRRMVSAASAYLQLPWDEPTDADIYQAAIDKFGFVERIDLLVARDLCIHFVRRRNASLLPKPVDPRRKAIIDTINRQPASAAAASTSDGPVGELADKILAAMDEVKHG